jgi:long-subunit acyl-CoA synthetase (AMP-forming)
MAFAKTLHALNVPERSVVLIQGTNSPEHFAVMAGTVLANCIYTDIYATNSQDVCMHQAEFTEASVIVCDTFKRLKEKFLDSKNFGNLKVKCAILFKEGLLPQTSKYSYFNGDVKIYNWTQALALGSEVENRVIMRKVEN